MPPLTLLLLRIGMMIEQDEMLRLSTKTKINDQVDRNHHQSERDTEKKKKKKRKKKRKKGKKVSSRGKKAHRCAARQTYV
jgi:hypothetical protein